MGISIKRPCGQGEEITVASSRTMRLSEERSGEPKEI